ncbi:MAG TPA: YceI family protein [Polyangiaceae bacterium]|nr:YceI family protein [Polyangiaceae bacterium]
MNTNTWALDTAHSGISFSVRHMVVAKVRGRFATWTGSVELDESDLSRSRVEVEIDASSIDTGVAQRDQHLRSADFLDVEQFPTLRFQSKRIENVRGDRFDVIGELTLHGQTREVTLAVERGGQAKDPWGNQRVGFSARASILRSEFGLTWNQALETGGVLVADRIEIELDVQAVQNAARKTA